MQYNAANQVTAMNYYGFAETRAYNNLMQLSNITATAPGQTGINVTYNYTPGGNSGKVTSATDALSGETVTYQYDALNRLISAAGSGWAQTQAYDGFGNLIGRTGTGTAQGTTISTPVNAATNQLSGYAYDANGNQISSGYGYDAENRIVSANAGGVEYLYDAQNKRVWQGNFSGGVLTTQSVTLFGADGKMLNTYGIAQVGTTVSFGGGPLRAYFGGKLVGQLQTSGLMGAVVQDRLGSVGKYYPYGEERNAPPLANDQVKFATYTRDAATGNDYADQRYYSSALGRFLNADPSWGSVSYSNPQSWNRYSYVFGDPINGSDPSGLCTTIIGGITQTPWTAPTSEEQKFASNVGAITAFPYAGDLSGVDIANVVVQGAGVVTGATLTALEAIALAAQNPGPIDIIAFSGGAAAFADAYKYLTQDVKNRIGNITFIDPGSFSNLGTFAGGNVAVYADNSDLGNALLNFFDPLPVTVDTGNCGHDSNCVFQNFADSLAKRASDCPTGAGSSFGAPGPLRVVPLLFSFPNFGYLPFLFYFPTTPSVTSSITYGPVEDVSSTITYDSQ